MVRPIDHPERGDLWLRIEAAENPDQTGFWIQSQPDQDWIRAERDRIRANPGRGHFSRPNAQWENPLVIFPKPAADLSPKERLDVFAKAYRMSYEAMRSWLKRDRRRRKQQGKPTYKVPPPE